MDQRRSERANDEVDVDGQYLSPRRNVLPAARPGQGRGRDAIDGRTSNLGEPEGLKRAGALWATKELAEQAQVCKLLGRPLLVGMPASHALQHPATDDRVTGEFLARVGPRELRARGRRAQHPQLIFDGTDSHVHVAHRPEHLELLLKLRNLLRRGHGRRRLVANGALKGVVDDGTRRVSLALELGA